MLIDTHCHLDFKDFESDRDLVIERAKRADVGAIINVGASMTGTKESIALAERYDFIYAACGIHPHDADRVTDDDLNSFHDLLDNKKVIALGEIGLDYYKKISSENNQKKLFRRLLKEAKDKGLPVIIHNRDAHLDTLGILKDVMGDPIRGVMHCFSGDNDFLERCLKMGLCVSFTCNLTFKNAGRLRDVAKSVPMDRLLLETDAPFLAPQAFRGKRNEPGHIKYLAEEISRIKGIGIEEAAGITTENAKRLFSIC